MTRADVSIRFVLWFILDSIRWYSNLCFLDGFRWKIQSGEHKCSSFYWLAAETRQTIENLKDSLQAMIQHFSNVLCLLQKKS